MLNLQGDLVEEYTIGPREAAVAEALGEPRFETRLRDILAAIEHGARDPQITRAVLVLDEMGAGGQATSLTWWKIDWSAGETSSVK